MSGTPEKTPSDGDRVLAGLLGVAVAVLVTPFLAIWVALCIPAALLMAVADWARFALERRRYRRLGRAALRAAAVDGTAFPAPETTFEEFPS